MPLSNEFIKQIEAKYKGEEEELLPSTDSGSDYTPTSTDDDDDDSDSYVSEEEDKEICEKEEKEAGEPYWNQDEYDNWVQKYQQEYEKYTEQYQHYLQKQHPNSEESEEGEGINDVCEEVSEDCKVDLTDAEQVQKSVELIKGLLQELEDLEVDDER